MTKSGPPEATGTSPDALSDETQPGTVAAPVVVSAKVGDLKLVIIAGEDSGDKLGGKLMAAINERRKGQVRYLGVGGRDMGAQGLVSQFPMEEVAVMGLGAIARRLPSIVQRVYQTVNSTIAAQPDAVVIIDAPEFTHPIAKRIRRKAPRIPIIDYVSPSVWAWRAGRARKMSRYIDHVLALLPFEPKAHERLGGPPCDYVGHPLIERAPWIRSLDTKPLAERLGLNAEQRVLVILPGSRGSEVSKLMAPFGKTLELLIAEGHHPQVIIPLVEARRAMIEEAVTNWPLRPHLITGDTDKFRAFRLADAALAASGTVTLELAVAGTPMVVGYKVEQATYQIVRHMIKAKSAVLANLVLGENAFPEFLQGDCRPERLAPAVAELLDDTPARRLQLNALSRIADSLAVPGGDPSQTAAAIVLRYAEKGRPVAAQR